MRRLARKSHSKWRQNKVSKSDSTCLYSSSSGRL